MAGYREGNNGIAAPYRRIIWAVGGIKVWKYDGNVPVLDSANADTREKIQQMEKVKQILKELNVPYKQWWAESKQYPGTIMYRFTIDGTKPDVTNEQVETIKGVLRTAGIK